MAEQAFHTAAASLSVVFILTPPRPESLSSRPCIHCSLSEVPESHQTGADTGGNLSNDTSPGRVTFMSRTRSVPASSSDLEAAAVGISDQNVSLDDSLEHKPLLRHESASDAV